MLVSDQKHTKFMGFFFSGSTYNPQAWRHSNSPDGQPARQAGRDLGFAWPCKERVSWVERAKISLGMRYVFVDCLEASTLHFNYTCKLKRTKFFFLATLWKLLHSFPTYVMRGSFMNGWTLLTELISGTVPADNYCSPVKTCTNDKNVINIVAFGCYYLLVKATRLIHLSPRVIHTESL